MKPNRMSWNSGMPNASAKVARSRRRCRNSFWKMARNDCQIVDVRSRSLIRSMSRRLSVARRRRLLGQRHEDVLERRRDGADRRRQEAGVAQPIEQLLIAERARD